jgi:hypothetical protein
MQREHLLSGGAAGDRAGDTAGGRAGDPVRDPRRRPGQAALARRLCSAAVSLGVTLATIPAVTALLAGTTAVAARADEVTASQDNLRTGWDPGEPGLSPAVLRSGHFGRVFARNVRGQVYAQPLIAGPTLVVATERNWVYGLNEVTGRRLWSDHLGTPWPAATTTCTDLTPTVGITSTPVYDAQTGVVYLIAEIAKRAPTQPVFSMFGIKATTGRITERVLIGGRPFNDSQLRFDAFDQWQRTGLLLLGGRVYAGFGSHCDDQPYAGFVADVDVSTRAVRLWTDEAGVADQQAGIWQSGGGLMSDGPGRIFFTSGNGVSPAPGKGFAPPGQLAESVVRLAVRPGGRLVARDFFSPGDGPALDAADTDFGSGGPVGLPFGSRAFPRLLVQAGKDGRVFLLDRDHLGGRMQGPGGADDYVSKSGPFGGQWGHSAVFGDATIVTARDSRRSSDYVYYVGKDDYLRALKLRVSRTGRPRLADVANSTMRFGFGSGSPVVTSSGTGPGSAVVWVVRAADISGTGGTLDAFAAVPSARCARPCVMRPIWSAPIGTASKFSIPATGSGYVYVGTTDGQVLGFARRTRAPLGRAAPVTFGGTGLGSATSRIVTVTTSARVTVTGVTARAGRAPEPFTVGRVTVTAGAGHRAVPVTFPVTLRPDASLHARVTFRPAARGGTTGVLTFTTPAARYGVTQVPLSGYGTKPGLYAQPRALSFAYSNERTTGQVPVGTAVPMTAEITNSGTATETVTAVTGPAGPFTAVGLPRPGTPIRPGQSIVVQVTYAPRRAGPAASSVTIAESSGKRVTVQLAGSALPPVSRVAAPARVTVGRVRLGGRAMATIDITNAGNLPATVIVAAPLTAPFAAIYRVPHGLPLSPGNELRIPVTFTPARAGTTTGDYQLIWTDLLGTHTLDVRLSGTGVS